MSAGLITRATGLAAGGPVPQIIHELARGAMGGIMGKTKLLAAGLLAAGLAVGTGLIPTAGGQVPGAGPAGPGPGGPPPGGSLGPPGPGAPPPPPPAAGNPFDPRGPGAMPGMGSMGVAPRVEYKYVTRPKFDGRWSESFKKILSAQAADGWEYVGTIPDVPGEMIFKRTPTRGSDPFGGMGTGMSPPMPGGPPPGPPGGYGPPSAGPRPGGSSNFPPPGMGGPGMPPGPGGPGGPGPALPPGVGSELGGPPRVPGGTGPSGPPPGVGPGSSEGPAGFPGGPSGPPAAGGEEGSAGPMPGGAGPGAPKRAIPNEIALTTGETIRHRMLSGAEIDRIKVIKGGTKVADVTLDPVNAKRVVIAATGRGGDMTVELTDANGVKETYAIRVR